MEESKLSIGAVLPTKIIVREHKKEEETKTGSGIILPSIGKNPQTSATVLLTGSGTPNLPMIVKVGQTVLYTPLSGQRFHLEGEGELVLLDQASVLFFY